MARYPAYDELDEKPSKKSSSNRPKRASLLGFLAVLIGMVAVGLTQRDKINQIMNERGWPGAGFLFQVKEYQVEPYHVAAAGAGVAVLALLLRRMTGRTRMGWPVLAILLCAGAAGTWRYQHSPREPGSPERWVQDNVVDKVAGWLNKAPATPQPALTPPATQPSGEVVSTPTEPAPANSPTSKPSSNIFGL